MEELPKCLKLQKKEFRTYLSNIELKMEKFWETIVFHHYTDHGLKHSHRIINQLMALLAGYPNLLNQQERFILLASVYLHDVGMQSPLYAGLRKKKYTEYNFEEIEIVRELHHISSAQMIIDSIKPSAENDFGLKDCKDYVVFIAEVSKYHTELDIAKLNDTWNLSEQVRMPLLAALMRLGDALDMDYRRVNLDVLGLWDIPVLSKFHWWAHHYVRSVHISGGKIGLIFRFSETYRGEDFIDEFKKKIEDSIKRHFDEVYDILFSYNVKLFREPQIENVVYEPEEMLKPIPNDLLDFVKARMKELKNIQIKTGIQFYVDGIPYSDDKKMTDSILRFLSLFGEGMNEAARIEVERCLTFALSPWQRLLILNIAGNVSLVVGDLNGALQSFRDALGICGREDLKEIYRKDVKDVRASVLGSMGIVYRDKDDPDEALRLYGESLEIYLENGNRKGESTVLGNMGLVYYDKGDLDEALRLYGESLEIDREIGHRQGESTVLGNIGVVYRDKGDLDEALRLYGEALEIDREIGFRLGEASVLGNIGIVYDDKGDLDEALRLYGESLEIYREIGHRKGEATLLNNMGFMYYDKGDLDEAVNNLESALTIYKQIQSSQVEKIENTLKKIRG